MKNLQATIRRNIDLESNSVGFCVDSDNGILFVLTKEFKLLKAHIYSEDITLEEQDLQDKLAALIGSSTITQNDVKLFELVVEIGGLLLALKSGHLIIISVSSTDCQCIYKHRKNLSSISLSPSQDLIALADEDNDIQIMFSVTCEITHQSNALTQNESLHKPVGVGWGSKETQFFGLDGRPSQEKKQADKIELSAEEMATSDQIEGSVRFNEFQQCQERTTVIDWRGDGQLIATLTFLPESDKHYIKVWNRNLELQYMSEQLVTVERGLLCWIPDGRYICCAQRRDRRLNEIALFEKNGLVRQRITLPSMMLDMYISNMAWSSDSKILAIIVKQFYLLEGEVHFDNMLMLYSMQNWHYYLKSTIKLKNNCEYSLTWDASNINRLHIMSSHGHFVEYDCCFQVTYSNYKSTVAVVDGNKVLVTPLETCVIPPPMSAITLITKSLISKLAIDHAANIFILTYDDHLIRTNSNTTITQAEDSAMKIELNNKMSCKLYERLTNYEIFSLGNANCYQHLIPIDDHNLIASRITPTGSEIILIKIPEIANNELVFETLKTFEKRQVVCMSPCATKQTQRLNIILNDSCSFWLDYNGSIEPSLHFQSTVAESKFSYNIIDLHTVNQSVISLGQDYCLRFNKNLLASNCCTSFRLTENYLVYTTSENNLHFILLTNLLNDAFYSDSWSQQIENGGTLVTVSEIDSKVVLQMPRGNLETIHPRVLLFSRLAILMRENKFVEACMLARRHRINMNFLVDYFTRVGYDYEKCWSNFALAIANQNPNLLCLIITELENCDTISGRYHGIMKHIPTKLSNVLKKFDVSEKVNRFCSSVELPPTNELLYPRIQCLLKMEPKKTKEALKIVHSLEADSKLDAIKYILYFIDIDQLFKDALSTYNTDIALMVASASNKDPKQYLALLDDFNSIKNESHRCYKIDIHIKRYDQAFNHLYSLSSQQVDGIEATEDNILELVVSKRIYRHAICHLQSLTQQVDTYEFKLHLVPGAKNLVSLISRIWAKYAEYLLEKRHYDEAGLAFSKALNTSTNVDHLNSALKCYSFIEDWEKSAAMIMRCKLSIENKQDASRRLVKQLIERSKYYEAMIVEQLISRSFETKVDMDCVLGLLNAGNWYLAEIFAGNEFADITNHVDLLKQINIQVEDWSLELNKANDQFERLKEVLTTQQTRQDLVPERGFVSDSLSTVDGSELSSISGSSNSHQQAGKIARSGATSIKTRSSSRSNKPAHKRINLKIGSRHEDIALVLELKKFMLKQKTNCDECAKYSSTLFQYLVSTEQAYVELKKLNNIITKSLEFAQQVSELLWPTGPHLEQRYSLYKRFNNALLSESPENIDFEILIRPEVPRTLNLFDI